MASLLPSNWRRRQALVCIVTLLAALGLAWTSPRLAKEDWDWTWQFQKIVRKARTHNLNWKEEGDGYYEQLLNTSDWVGTAKSGTFLDGLRRRAEPPPEIVDYAGSFLVYELKPNLDVWHPEEWELITNAHGLADIPYTLEKPPGTRRIALLGDSVSRSMGVPLGHNYEALLEERLNERHTGGANRRFEILNFSASGYRITQFVDLASEKAARFQPDVYVLALTDLIFRAWSEHLWSLISHGIDLKYDYLREVVQSSGAARGLGHTESKRRLEPYRLEVIRWALRHIREAAGPGVPVVIFLIPNADEWEVLERRFYSTKELLAEFDFPVIDVLDTFDRVPDLEILRLTPMNLHFNARGHRILFENLYRKLREDPHAWKSIAGNDAP